MADHRAWHIARLLNETGGMMSPEFQDAITEYFGHSSDNEVDDGWGSASDQENESDVDLPSDAENDCGTGSLIDQPPVFAFPDWSTCESCDASSFSLNAGKPDRKLLGTFTCSCKLDDGQPCSRQFPAHELWDMRSHHISLTRDELDAVILGKLSSCLKLGDKTCNTKRSKNTDRKKVRSQYRLHGIKICRDVFKYIHGVEKARLDALISHFREEGLTPRKHGNKNRMPKHALSFNQQKEVIDFISNFAETHGILLPGRIPGYSRTDLKLLPSSTTKTVVYGDYVTACEAAQCRHVALRTFFYLWKKYLPNILPMKPMTDLCWICQKNNGLIQRAATLTDADKMEAAANAVQHLTAATNERQEYNRIVQLAKDAVSDAGVTHLDDPQADCNRLDCSRDMLAHYSFDFAQQIHYPSDPQQPGPIFFKTPRKCALFGVMTEALPQMVLFLLDEAVDVGKGANTVISMLHFFFKHYGLKETTCHLHADNCSGQNKNNAMLQYLLWRVITGRHTSITLSFLLTGHTKFGPDGCFGLFKRKFRRTKVDCLDDIVRVTKQASSSGVLIPQLCGNQRGDVLVPTVDWTAFLGQWFRKLVGLKQFQHFEFQPSGEVLCRERVGSAVQIYNMLKAPVDFNDNAPPAIKPAGLSIPRQQYLYHEIREFVHSDHQGSVCPQPKDSEAPSSEPSTSSTAASQHRTPGRPKKKPRGMAAKKLTLTE